MFYSYHIDVQLSHLNKDYLLTYLLTPNSVVIQSLSMHSMTLDVKRSKITVMRVYQTRCRRGYTQSIRLLRFLKS